MPLFTTVDEIADTYAILILRRVIFMPMLDDIDARYLPLRLLICALRYYICAILLRCYAV